MKNAIRYSPYIFGLIVLYAHSIASSDNLYKAVAQDDIKTLSRLVHQGHNANQTYSKAHETIIMVAAAHGSYNALCKLYKAGALIHTKSGLGFFDDNYNLANSTLLHYAAYGGNERIITFLLNLNNNKSYLCRKMLFEENARGHLPIHIAAYRGHHQALIMLLDAMVSGYTSEHMAIAIYKKTLLLAIEHGHKECVKELIDIYTIYDCRYSYEDRYLCAEAAALNEHIDILEFLLDKKHTISVPQLFIACATHNKTITASYLMKRFAIIVPLHGEKAFIEAFSKRQNEMLKILYAHGIVYSKNILKCIYHGYNNQIIRNQLGIDCWLTLSLQVENNPNLQNTCYTSDILSLFLARLITRGNWNTHITILAQLLSRKDYYKIIDNALPRCAGYRKLDKLIKKLTLPETKDLFSESVPLLKRYKKFVKKLIKLVSTPKEYRWKT